MAAATIQLQAKPLHGLPTVRPAPARRSGTWKPSLSRVSLFPGDIGKTQRIRAWQHRTHAVVWKSPQHSVQEAEEREYDNTTPAGTPPTNYPNSDKVVSSPDVVSRFVEALNRREHPILSSLLSQECAYANLALQTKLAGKQAIMGFYKETHSSLPGDFQIIVDSASGGNTQNIGLQWHVEMAGMELPMSRGISFYQVDDDGRICSITDSPEHMLRLAAPLASITLPMLNHLPPTVIQLTNLDFGSAMTSAMHSLPMGSGMVDLVGVMQRSIMDNPLQTLLNFIADPASITTTASIAAPKPQTLLSDRNGEVKARQPAAVWGKDTTPQQTHTPAVHKEADTPTGTVRMKASSKVSSEKIVMRPLGEPSVAFVDAPVRSPWDDVPAKAQASMATPPPAMQELGKGFVNLTGIWEKDEDRCDISGYERTLDLMEIKGLARVTARIIEGIEIKHEADLFSVGFITIVPCFQVTETMKFSGPSRMMRRDLRFGLQTASAKRTPTGVQVNAEWGSPMAGKTTEVYEVTPDGELHIHTAVTVNGKTESMTLVLVKNAGGKDALLAKSRQRNQSLQDVLRHQEEKYGKLPQ